ncbi:MAG: plasmid encoded RepA protein [Bacteroidetes bacterium]|nr:plasmid encoded RepA protein [Bacteroidota bacterium]
MSNKKREPKDIIPLKRAYAAQEIRKDNGNAPIDQAIFQHAALCQTFFPYKSQDKSSSPHYWKKEQGRAVLSIQALNHENPITGETVALGIPYGAKIRLIMAFINTEIVRTQSSKIEVSDSVTAFIRNDLKLHTDGRTIRQVKDQLARLAGCIMQVSFGDVETGQSHVRRFDIVDGYDLWFPKSPDQKVLWNSYIEISERYTKGLLEHAIPLDMRAVAALSNNPMALDAYSWLVYRLHRIPRNKPQPITWVKLYEQFGTGYTRIRDFRAAFLSTLKQVKLVYPDARLEEFKDKKTGISGGLLLYNSPPAIGHKLYIPAHFKKLKESMEKRAESEKRLPSPIKKKGK